jgi:ATP-dependent DNA ligase
LIPNDNPAPLLFLLFLRTTTSSYSNSCSIASTQASADPARANEAAKLDGIDYYPGFIASALATSISKVPSGARWIHEVKFDGYRAQVHIRDAAVTGFTRRGNDWTKRLKTIEDNAWPALQSGRQYTGRP